MSQVIKQWFVVEAKQKKDKDWWACGGEHESLEWAIRFRDESVRKIAGRYAALRIVRYETHREVI